ncbi:mannitol-1-phosphate 5-dehydrogenase [Lineolata rhizophorae]|uniref:Mannitol-1-phosphate 5-dehydrogenase n=1 Tax=Lineolata rhizophorae TaxID=578093 RepID=A0A6A6NUC4_9PEZI|nr:mannitol-1-phosphate 5-dehydrogenase [Lineolata rhizophorae]
MYEKVAVHFGGGNIGRGFVAEFLHKSGYEVVFIDVMDSIIEALQNSKHYTVTEIGEDGERTFDINHYRAINSKYEEAKVVDEIAKADVVTCAVGPNILKFIAPVIAKGIEARTVDYPLAVIACENAINATDTLASFIKQKLAEETLATLDTKARFANSAIDRIVPHQDPDAGLNVKIEKFYEWCVELPPFQGAPHPEIDGVHYVNDLTPYIERKLFTVNTSHATAAYYGYNRKKALIHDAMEDAEIHDIVRECLRETASLIVAKHGISAAEQNDYVEQIISRISNPALEDKVERVGRAPLRKLSRKERFIGPASQLAERGMKHSSLLGAVEMALRFQNVEGDDESVELAKILKETDAKEATTKLTGLEETHPLFPDVKELVTKVQSG